MALGSTLRGSLPIAKKYHVAAINWGLSSSGKDLPIGTSYGGTGNSGPPQRIPSPIGSDAMAYQGHCFVRYLLRECNVFGLAGECCCLIEIYKPILIELNSSLRF